MQRAASQGCQSAMLPILEVRGMIVFVQFEGVVCFPFLVMFCFLRSGSHCIALPSLALTIYQASLQLHLCLLRLKACTTVPAQRPVFTATLRAEINRTCRFQTSKIIYS